MFEFTRLPTFWILPKSCRIHRGPPLLAVTAYAYLSLGRSKLILHALFPVADVRAQTWPKARFSVYQRNACPKSDYKGKNFGWRRIVFFGRFVMRGL
jgi:hypothetical protein